MKNKTIFIVSGIFVLIMLTMLCLILWGPSNLVAEFEFSSVVLCFAFSMIFVCCSSKVWLTETALLFTTIADLFLEIIHPMNQIVAMIAFSTVQLLYFTRLFLELSKKWKIVNLSIRVALVAVVEILTFVLLKDKYDFLSAISMFYITNLISNIVLAFFEFKKSPLLAFGLLLFLGCDIVVGLQCAIGVYIDVPTTSILYQISHTSFNISWLCYLPSQTLIALSVAKSRLDFSKEKIK